ncbi:Phage integrase family protein [compost metagenome]
MNEVQLKRKGANCFLFRAFKEEEPPSHCARLSERLAAALYFTQPKNLSLATFKGGSPSALYRYESKYTPHSMRVSLITAYVMEFGLPIEVIMKLAGHASVVMSIYYVKVGAAYLRRRMDEGEKLALRDQAYAAQEMLEQNRLDELVHELVANSGQALQVLKAGNVGSTLVRDYGLCPYAAARCEDGGPNIAGTKVWVAVPAGYLGMQNCVRCRHFITGPMFLGGMLSLWNEISLSIKFLSEHYLTFEREVSECLEKIKVEDELEYDLEKAGGVFDSGERNRIEREMRKLQSEKESVAKKMDMFFCDMQMLTKQINECKALIADSAGKDNGQVQLVVHFQNEIKAEIEETTFFQQLNEVCVNASIFQSASADLAAPRRSQMIDRMAQFNKMRPVMLSLSENEQLVVGNQVTKFLLHRLKTWERVNQLICGHILLDDLSDDERISKEEFSELMTSKTPQLLDFKEIWG